MITFRILLQSWLIGVCIALVVWIGGLLTVGVCLGLACGNQISSDKIIELARSVGMITTLPLLLIAALIGHTCTVLLHFRAKVPSQRV